MKNSHKHSSGNTSNIHKGFTLVELIIGVGIIGILASIVMVAINPSKQLADAYDAERKNNVRNYGIGINKYIIDNLERPTPIRNLPSDEDDAAPICKYDINGPSCRNLDVLVPDYMPEIPVDILEDEGSDDTGYSIYEANGQRPIVVSLFLGMSDSDTNSSASSNSSSDASSSSSSNSSFAWEDGMPEYCVSGADDPLTNGTYTVVESSSYPAEYENGNGYTMYIHWLGFGEDYAWAIDTEYYSSNFWTPETFPDPKDVASWSDGEGSTSISVIDVACAASSRSAASALNSSSSSSSLSSASSFSSSSSGTDSYCVSGAGDAAANGTYNVDPTPDPQYESAWENANGYIMGLTEHGFEPLEYGYDIFPPSSSEVYSTNWYEEPMPDPDVATWSWGNPTPIPTITSGDC